MRTYFHRRAFTLIELLVVISIISLLSSVVLASLNSAREKGRIAAAQRFATHTYRSFGAEAAGIWNFEDFVAGWTSIKDNSVNANDAFFPAVAVTINTSSADTPNKGSQISVECTSGGSSKYAYIRPKGSLADITDDNRAVTYSIWFKPAQTTASLGHIIGRNQTSGHHSGITYTNAGIVRGLLRNGNSQLWVNSSKNLTMNQWHHIALSVDGVKRTAGIYVDGALTGTTDLSAVVLRDYPSEPNSHYYLCSASAPVGGSSYHSAGLIDEAHIYTQALTSAQVQKLYADSKDRYLAHEDTR